MLRTAPLRAPPPAAGHGVTGRGAAHNGTSASDLVTVGPSSQLLHPRGSGDATATVTGWWPASAASAPHGTRGEAPSSYREYAAGYHPSWRGTHSAAPAASASAYADGTTTAAVTLAAGAGPGGGALGLESRRDVRVVESAAPYQSPGAATRDMPPGSVAATAVAPVAGDLSAATSSLRDLRDYRHGASTTPHAGWAMDRRGSGGSGGSVGRDLRRLPGVQGDGLPVHAQSQSRERSQLPAQATGESRHSHSQWHTPAHPPSGRHSRAHRDRSTADTLRPHPGAPADTGGLARSASASGLASASAQRYRYGQSHTITAASELARTLDVLASERSRCRCDHVARSDWEQLQRRYAAVVEAHATLAQECVRLREASASRDLLATRYKAQTRQLKESKRALAKLRSGTPADDGAGGAAALAGTAAGAGAGPAVDSGDAAMVLIESTDLAALRFTVGRQKVHIEALEEELLKGAKALARSNTERRLESMALAVEATVVEEEGESLESDSDWTDSSYR